MKIVATYLASFVAFTSLGPIFFSLHFSSTWQPPHGAVRFWKWTFPRVLWDWQHKSSLTLGNVHWTFPWVILFLCRTFPRVTEHFCCQSQSTHGNVRRFSNIKGWRHRAHPPQGVVEESNISLQKYNFIIFFKFSWFKKKLLLTSK